MTRETSPKNKPGTERFRDEQREDGGPRMEGGEWHDYESPRDLEPEAIAGEGAVIEQGLDGSPDTKDDPTRKRTTPEGKGTTTEKTREAKGSRRGAKGTGRDGNPG